MTDHSRVMTSLCEIDRRQGFGQRAYLVYLDQNRIRHMLGDTSPEKFHVRDEEIVADQLNVAAKFFR